MVKKALPIISILIIVLLVIVQPWEVHARGVAKVADLPVGLSRTCCAAADDGCIYVIGGNLTSNTFNNTIIRFNPSDKSVTTVAGLEKNFRGGWAINYDGKIYFGGGHYGSQPSEDIFIFDYSENSISTVTPPTSMRVYTDRGKGNTGAFLYSGSIYVFWGVLSGTGTYQTTIKNYDIANNTATTISKPPSVLYYSVCDKNNKAYIVGYYNNTYNDTGVLVFDPTTNDLGKVANFTYYAGMTTVFGDDGLMYGVGGKIMTNPKGLKSDIIVYDPDTHATGVVGHLPNPLAYASSALGSNGKIYIFGGIKDPDSDNGTTDILEIDPDTLNAPPDNFILSGSLDGNTANLDWTVADGASHYILERSTDGTNFSELTQTTNRTYSDPGLSPGTYFYRAKAVNANGVTLSNVVTLVVQEPPPPPETLILTGDLDGDDVDLSWNEITDATKYILERSTDGTNFSEIIQTTDRTYSDPGLPPGTYYYRVKAIKDGEDEIISNIVKIIIQEPPQPPTPPRFWVYWPEGGQYVKVEWDRGNVDLSGYMCQLWRVDTVSGVWIQVKDIPESEKPAFDWTDTNVTAAINYKYQIRTFNMATWEWEVAIESDWAVLERPFAAPGGLRVTSSSEASATITWIPVSGANSYQVQTGADGINWSEYTVSGPPITVTRPCIVRVRAGTHARSQWSGALYVLTPQGRI